MKSYFDVSYSNLRIVNFDLLPFPRRKNKMPEGCWWLSNRKGRTLATLRLEEPASRTELEAELVTARSICFVPTFANGRDCWKIVTKMLWEKGELRQEAGDAL